MGTWIKPLLSNKIKTRTEAVTLPNHIVQFLQCVIALQHCNFWIAHNKRNHNHNAKMILIQILLANSKVLHSLQVTGCSFSRLLSSANGRNITTSSKMQIDAFISAFHSYLIWEFSPSFFWQKWSLFSWCPSSCAICISPVSFVIFSQSILQYGL